MPKINYKIGDVFKIPLKDGFFSYGVLLANPLAGFFNILRREDILLESIYEAPIAFRIWIVDSAITGKKWPIIGNKEPPNALLTEPSFFKQDPLNKKFSIYQSGQDTLASRDDCIGLERAAVWRPDHVVERLKNMFFDENSPILNLMKLPER